MQDTHLVWLQMQMSWSILHTLIISKTGNSPKWNWNEVWLVCERFFFIFIPDKNRQKQFILQLFLLIVISGRYIYYYFWSKNVWCTKTISNTHTLKQFLGSVVSCNFGNCFYSIHPSYIRVELSYLYTLSYSVCLILPLTRGGICNMKYQVVCNTKLHTYLLNDL